MASVEQRSVRTLRERIDLMLYERTVPTLAMSAPYILDFLRLRNTWQESDIEAAVIVK